MVNLGSVICSNSRADDRDGSEFPCYGDVMRSGSEVLAYSTSPQWSHSGWRRCRFPWLEFWVYICSSLGFLDSTSPAAQCLAG